MTCESSLPKPSNRGKIYIGETLKDRRGLTLTNEERTGHVQIVGATGRGKTVSVIAPWFIRDFKSGHTPILIDGKGDEELVERIRTNARINSRDDYFKVFNLSDVKNSARLNPLSGGSPQEVADRIIASLEFESAYYRDVQHSAVLMALEVLKACGRVPTLPGLYEFLGDPGQLPGCGAERSQFRKACGH